MHESTVWKFELNAPGDFGLAEATHLPLNHSEEILSAGEQDGRLVVWALVHPRHERGNASRRVIVVGTGRTIPAGLLRFIGRITTGSLEWHVFEDTKS